MSNQYPGINFILKSRYEDLNESYNKPNTIFLAHVRRMHWVCISNIYLSSNTKNIDKELYVVYDCFTKASSSCSTHGDWLNGFSFFIEKLSPHLKKIAFYSVEIGFKVEADPALLALAYAVSIVVVVVVVHFRVVKLKNAKTRNVKTRTRKFRVPGTS